MNCKNKEMNVIIILDEKMYYKGVTNTEGSG